MNGGAAGTPASRGRRRLLSALLAIAVMAGASSGCGYSLAGRGAFLPEYIKTVAIPLFANSTTVFEVEQVLTQAVRQEFIGRGKYRVVPETAGAEAVLNGTIEAVTIQPSSFNDQQQATRYIAVVVMKVEFRDLRANRVLFENPSMVFREEFELSTGSSALDANAFFGQERNALERLATTFSRSVVTSILEAF